MIRRRLVLPALALATALGTAACTSSGSTAHDPHSSSAAPVAAPATGGARVAAGPLADRMQQALVAPRSVHLSITSTVTGETLTGSGELGLRSGAVESADVSDELPAKLGTVRLVRVGGTDYARLPTALAKRNKPWVVLDPHSSDVIAAQLAGIARPVLGVASPATLVALVRSSRSVRDEGRTAAGTHRYAVAVDPAHLPAAVPTTIAGGPSGTRTFQVELDGSDRPVRVSGTLTVSGLAVAASVALSGYDGPVTISAPPATQIAR